MKTKNILNSVSYVHFPCNPVEFTFVINRYEDILKGLKRNGARYQLITMHLHNFELIRRYIVQKFIYSWVLNEFKIDVKNKKIKYWK